MEGTLQAWLPWVVDVALGLTVAEIAWLAWRGRPGAGLAELGPTLGAGLALMLALRAVLAGAGAAWVLAALAVAGLAHVADLRRRLRGPGS